MIQCPQCKAEGIGPKEDHEFSVDQRRPGGRRSDCKAHARLSRRKYYQANTERVLARIKRNKIARDARTGTVRRPYRWVSREPIAPTTNAMLNWRRTI